MATMKPVRIHAYGDPDVLIYEDAPRPSIAEDEVLIRVHAAGVNPVDGRFGSDRRGWFGRYRAASGHLIPIPGILLAVRGIQGRAVISPPAAGKKLY